LKTAALGVAALGSAAPLTGASGCKTKRKVLRILHRRHFVPAFDRWFNEKYVKEWGEKNDVDVVVDNVETTELDQIANAQLAHRKGHDLLGLTWPRPMYEDDVIDHADVVQECERRYGKAVELAFKSTYNPRTKKYFGVCDSVSPNLLHWRKDLFDEAGGRPESWDDVYRLGKQIKETRGVPVGIGLGDDVDASSALRAILYSFGASEQDAEGRLTIDSKETLEAVKFVKALFQETMHPEVLSWDPASNNKAMLASKISLTMNAVSITREAEDKGLSIGDQIWLAKTPKGPARRLSVNSVVHTYFIWQFAENIETAKRFLVDFIGRTRDDFLASEFFDFPSFRGQVPDLLPLLKLDGRATPQDKYTVLADAADWSVNVGYPGFTNAAIDEGYSRWILNTMFAQAATGAATPEEAVRAATKKYEAVWQKWSERKLL
jgi:multiple sugar transport system substrate-binding protein